MWWLHMVPSGRDTLTSTGSRRAHSLLSATPWTEGVPGTPPWEKPITPWPSPAPTEIPEIQTSVHHLAPCVTQQLYDAQHMLCSLRCCMGSHGEGCTLSLSSIHTCAQFTWLGLGNEGSGGLCAPTAEFVPMLGRAASKGLQDKSTVTQLSLGGRSQKMREPQPCRHQGQERMRGRRCSRHQNPLQPMVQAMMRQIHPAAHGGPHTGAIEHVP